MPQSAAKYKFWVHPSKRPSERQLLNNIDGAMTSFSSAVDYFWKIAKEAAAGSNELEDAGELVLKAGRLLKSSPSFIIPAELWLPPENEKNNTRHQRGLLFQHGTSGRFSAVETGRVHDNLPTEFPVLDDDTEYTPCAVLLDYDETMKQGTLLVWKNERKSPYSLFTSSFRYVLKATYGLGLELEPDLDRGLLEEALEAGGLRELRLVQPRRFKDRSDDFESGEPAERDYSLVLSLKHSRGRPLNLVAAKNFVRAKVRQESRAADETFRQMREELHLGDFEYEEAAVVVELLAGNDRREKVFSLEDEEPGRALNERIDRTLDGLPGQLIKTQPIKSSTVETLFERLGSVL